MKLIFATGNQNKLREIREILSEFKIDVISMKEAGILSDPEESGTTFRENALQKAHFVFREYIRVSEDEKVIVLADDSGLEIDALQGEPGVYSARYMGKDTSYHIKNQSLIDRLSGVPDEKRTARFVCAAAAVFPDGTDACVVETMEGRIAYSEAGENGFGYDPIFFLPEYNKTSAEISPEEKNKISHRGKALRKIKDLLSGFLNEYEG